MHWKPPRRQKIVEVFHRQCSSGSWAALLDERTQAAQAGSTKAGAGASPGHPAHSHLSWQASFAKSCVHNFAMVTTVAGVVVASGGGWWLAVVLGGGLVLVGGGGLVLVGGWLVVVLGG